mmetsp:Transcript_45021/g.108890  ORF Transcript_45021/g.108890 Transcript_45021/m.108890 type:complete len:267 (-) Transcript_45021:667-1467(-)
MPPNINSFGIWIIHCGIGLGISLVGSPTKGSLVVALWFEYQILKASRCMQQLPGVVPIGFRRTKSSNGASFLVFRHKESWMIAISYIKGKGFKVSSIHGHFLDSPTTKWIKLQGAAIFRFFASDPCIPRCLATTAIGSRSTLLQHFIINRSSITIKVDSPHSTLISFLDFTIGNVYPTITIGIGKDGRSIGLIMKFDTRLDTIVIPIQSYSLSSSCHQPRSESFTEQQAIFAAGQFSWNIGNAGRRWGWIGCWISCWCSSGCSGRF